MVGGFHGDDGVVMVARMVYVGVVGHSAICDDVLAANDDDDDDGWRVRVQRLCGADEFTHNEKVESNTHPIRMPPHAIQKSRWYVVCVSAAFSRTHKGWIRLLVVAAFECVCVRLYVCLIDIN